MMVMMGGNCGVGVLQQKRVECSKAYPGLVILACASWFFVQLSLYCTLSVICTHLVYIAVMVLPLWSYTAGRLWRPDVFPYPKKSICTYI
jgi:hypothetical protein